MSYNPDDYVIANSPAVPSPYILGAYTLPVRAHADERGRFMETFRASWFPQVSWERMQSNRSESKSGVLRGLHYHFHQIDYWYVPAGKIRAAMVDLRPNSPSYLASQVIEMGEEHNLGLFIPVGVAHGFLALTDCTMTYIVNNYYDSSDEYGVAWDDPALRVAWGAMPNGLSSLSLSPRDEHNPCLSDILPEHRPK